MNHATIHAHCTVAGDLSREDQRKLMWAAVNACLFASAVDVALKDKTGLLKAELRRELTERVESRLRSLGEDDDIGPQTPEDRALCQLERG